MLRDLLPGSSTSPEMSEIGATVRLSSLVAAAGAPIITCTCDTQQKRGGRDTIVLAFECQRIPMEVVSDSRRVSVIGEHLRRSLHSVVGEAGPSTTVVAAPGLSNFSASPWGRSLTTGGHLQATVSLACDECEGWSLLLLCPTGRNTMHPQT